MASGFSTKICNGLAKVAPKFTYPILGPIWARVFINVPKGNQGIDVTELSPSFKEALEDCYDDFVKDYKPVGYTRWVQTCDYMSYAHYVYALVRRYGCRSICEIGTYKGALTMMLMKQMSREHEKFRIHSINVKDEFDIARFDPEVQRMYERNRDSIRFDVCGSQNCSFEEDYDLVIIDGERTPEGIARDFDNVEKRSSLFLFDDLHTDRLYEDAYVDIRARKSVHEEFFVYTKDNLNRDPHGLALLRRAG